MFRIVRAGAKACISCVAGALILGVVASPAASAQQSINFYIGGFVPRGQQNANSGFITGRGNDSLTAPDDVLAANSDFLIFNLKDFDATTFGAEYLAGLGDLFEAGLGVGYHTKSVPSVYADFVNANGTEIDQELKLRVVPVAATIRFLPMGHHRSVTPYIGAGVGIFSWRYTETGQFLGTDRSIFTGTFTGSGTTTGPVIVGGVRVPVGGWGIGGEVRYQKAQGDLPADQDFAGTKIDLGGITYSFVVNVRF